MMLRSVSSTLTTAESSSSRVWLVFSGDATEAPSGEIVAEGDRRAGRGASDGSPPAVERELDERISHDPRGRRLDGELALQLLEPSEKAQALRTRGRLFALLGCRLLLVHASSARPLTGSSRPN